MFEMLTPEGRLLRILSAICKQNGGELRIPLELVDSPGEATKIDLIRDRKTQELIIRGVKENEVMLETMRIKPEVSKASVTPIDTAREPLNNPEPSREGINGFTKSSSALSDDQLVELERKLQKRKIANMIAEDLKSRRRQNNEAGS